MLHKSGQSPVPGSVQSRFGMVGGLQCLMSALRELTKVERGGEMDKLCVCLLQCISATASGHCKTCDYTYLNTRL